MPYNGAGLFTPVYNWQTDKANGIKIRADRMDGQDGDIATGLSTAVTRDGQSPATANLPMAGFKHTGVGAASEATDYLRADQIQTNSLSAFTATGTNDYTITPSPAATALVTYLSFRILFTNGNTGACTLTVGALTQKALTKLGAVPLIAGDIPAGAIGECVYDGTQFILMEAAVEPDYFVASGTDTYTFTASPVLTAYAAGRRYNVLFTNANTGPATINVNGLGAKALTKLGATALGAGDLPAGVVTQCTYDGTRFQTGVPGSSTVLGLSAGAQKTSGFTAAVNTKYPCAFTANGTITFPVSATVGDVMVFALGGYYAYTLNPNGLKINTSTATLTVSGNQTLMVMYSGTTDGWV